MNKKVLFIIISILFIIGIFTYKIANKKDNNQLIVEMDKIILKENANYTLKAMTYPNEENITYKSLDESVVVIDEIGNFDTLKEGITTIEVKSKKQIKKIEVIVRNDDVGITGIKLTDDKAQLKVLDRFLLNVQLFPDNASYSDLSWESSNEEIVEIQDGYIKALQKGSSQITVTAMNGDTKIVDSIIVLVGMDDEKEVKELSFKEEVITLQLNETYQLAPIIKPLDASYQNIVYEIENEEIVDIEKGMIKGKNKGTTKITAKTSNGKSTELEVNVIANSGLTLNTEEVVIAKGETYQLKSNFVSGIEWYSSNNHIVTVNNGLIKGITNGDAIITIINNYGRMNTVNVKVEGNGTLVTGLISDRDEISIQSGKTIKLNVNVKPSNATNKEIIYETSDERIAVVDDDGLLLARASGSCIITAYSSNNKTLNIKVNVSKGAVTLDSLEINPSSITIIKDDTYQLKVNFIPSNIDDKNVEWVSGNSSIVSVSNGLIKGLKKGNTYVTATSNGITSRVEVTVSTAIIEISNLNITEENFELEIGERKTLNVTYLPKNATNKNFVWESSNSNVVTVDNKGIVSGVSEGTAKIICTSINGKNDVVTVTVKKPLVSNVEITNIYMSLENLLLQKGETKKLRATILPLNAKQNVTWISGDDNIAIVDDNGLVTAISAGSTSIAAIATNGMIAKANVKISYPPIDPPKNSNIKLMMNSDTIRVSLVEERGYHITRIWLADPGNQIHKTGGIGGLDTVPSQLNTAISQFGLENKIVVATNGSGFHSVKYDYDRNFHNSSLGRFIVTEGQILRNEPNYNENLSAQYYYYLFDKSGKLTATGGLGGEERHNRLLEREIYNSFAFYPIFMNDGEAWAIWNTGTARRQGLCQIDGNNYAIVTTGINGTLPLIYNVFVSLHCNTGVNLDGGGSTSLVFKYRNEYTKVFVGGVRKVGDALYFTE